MTRRGRTWALGLVAFGTLLPACTRTVPGVVGGATPMGDANGPMAVASGPGNVSPYNEAPRMPASVIPPRGDASPPVVEHHDTLLPPLDPTPGEAPAATVGITPQTTVMPTPTIATPKKNVLASLPGLAPANSLNIDVRPDRLPPAIPAKATTRPQRPASPAPAATSARVVVSPRTTEPQDKPLVQALRCFLDNRPGEALVHLKGYDKDNQDMLLLLLPLVARMAESKLWDAKSQDVTFYTGQLSNLLVRFRPRLSLVIDKICFCRDIRGFGMYDPLPDSPIYHRDDRVDIYVEVRNFVSEERALPGGGPVVYVTQLKTSAEIVTRDRKIKVWPAGNDRFVFHRDGPDICRTLRHDYFDHCYFTLPADLPAGAYTLSLQVEDLPTKRVVREALDFIVR